MTYQETIAEMQKVINGVSEKFIALVCSADDCKHAVVVARYETSDVPGATYMTQLCPKHENEGDIPAYFNDNDEELSQDERSENYGTGKP